MAMEDDKPEIKPRIINLVTPMLTVIFLSFFFFWYFGKSKDGANGTVSSVIAATDPNKAMLVALFISMIITGFIYCPVAMCADPAHVVPVPGPFGFERFSL